MNATRHADKNHQSREENEHPFAPFVRILGKGKKGSRSLTREEAREAMRMILADEALDLQVGAFLMLLRVKEETAEELAGFVEAAKDAFQAPADLKVDIDWSSYAGKRRHLPWFLLALKTLAQAGHRILIHGTEGHTHGRIYTSSLAEQIGIPICTDWKATRTALDQVNIAYLPLASLSPQLERIIQMRNVLGLRSPVHSLSRLLNPLNAPLVMQGIFHPPYAPLHQETGHLLGYPTTLVIKGDGGEIERNPDAACTLYLSHEGATTTEEWPALYSQRHMKGDDLSESYLKAIWDGTEEDEYAFGAITGTIALTLRGLGKALDADSAQQMAEGLWRGRRAG